MPSTGEVVQRHRFWTRCSRDGFAGTPHRFCGCGDVCKDDAPPFSFVLDLFFLACPGGDHSGCRVFDRCLRVVHRFSNVITLDHMEKMKNSTRWFGDTAFWARVCFRMLKPTVWLVGGFVVGCFLCHFGSRMHLLLFLWVYPFPIGLRPVFFTTHCGETCLPFRQNSLQQLCRVQPREFLWRSLCRRVRHTSARWFS